MNDLTRNWLLLIALTAGTIALASLDGRIAGAAILILAWCKARAILGGFLHLKSAPGWLSAFMVPLAIWLGVIGLLNAALIR